MKPVCVCCQRFYRVKKNGYYFIEAMPLNAKAPPGVESPSSWVPYKLWSGDLWECEGCGSRIVNGVGQSPVAEHYHADFLDWVQSLGADQLQVNDC
jgi:hypothetical protein